MVCLFLLPFKTSDFCLDFNLSFCSSTQSRIDDCIFVFNINSSSLNVTRSCYFNFFFVYQCCMFDQLAFISARVSSTTIYVFQPMDGTSKQLKKIALIPNFTTDYYAACVLFFFYSFHLIFISTLLYYCFVDFNVDEEYYKRKYAILELK